MGPKKVEHPVLCCICLTRLFSVSEWFVAKPVDIYLRIVTNG